jgi:hypothetical protein
MDKKFEIELLNIENLDFAEKTFDKISIIIDKAKKEIDLQKQEYLKDFDNVVCEVVEPMFLIEENGKFYLREIFRFKLEE